MLRERAAARAPQCARERGCLLPFRRRRRDPTGPAVSKMALQGRLAVVLVTVAGEQTRWAHGACDASTQGALAHQRRCGPQPWFRSCPERSSRDVLHRQAAVQPAAATHAPVRPQPWRSRPPPPAQPSSAGCPGSCCRSVGDGGGEGAGVAFAPRMRMRMRMCRSGNAGRSPGRGPERAAAFKRPTSRPPAHAGLGRLGQPVRHGAQH